MNSFYEMIWNLNNQYPFIRDIPLYMGGTVCLIGAIAIPIMFWWLLNAVIEESNDSRPGDKP